MSVSLSVFNEEKPNFKFWRKNASELQILAEGEPSHHLRARKRNHSSDDLKSRHYFIQSNLLYYKKNSSSQKISNVADLNWSRAHFQTLVTQNFGLLRKITILKNNKYSSLFPPNAYEFQKWKNALRKLCILADFEKRYVKVAVLGNNKPFQVNFISTKNFKIKTKIHLILIFSIFVTKIFRFIGWIFILKFYRKFHF